MKLLTGKPAAGVIGNIPASKTEDSGSNPLHRLACFLGG